MDETNTPQHAAQVPRYPQCRSWDEAEVHLTSLISRVQELERQLRHMQKQLDTAGTPWYKRVWFRINGWPAWWVVAKRPKWRPWHQWTGW